MAQLRLLRKTLAQLKLTERPVGRDGRNRTQLWAFGTKTSRNAPSTTKFIFGPAKWVRHLIKPAEGYGLAYLDWEHQEFGIAAVLSGDVNMISAYTSGDPYLAIGKQVGRIPPDGTKQSHGPIRDLFKVATLAIGSGSGAGGLARQLGCSPGEAAALLRLHRATYPAFWEWLFNTHGRAALSGSIATGFGWTFCTKDPSDRTLNDKRDRTIVNFPMQANGAEMMRPACAACRSSHPSMTPS